MGYLFRVARMYISLLHTAGPRLYDSTPLEVFDVVSTLKSSVLAKYLINENETCVISGLRPEECTSNEQRSGWKRRKLEAKKLRSLALLPVYPTTQYFIIPVRTGSPKFEPPFFPFHFY